MESCTQAVSQEELGATITSICAQGNGDVTWLSSFTTDQSLLYEDETFLLHNPSCGQINVVDIAQAQDRDRNIKRVKDIIKSQQTPALKERKHETAELIGTRYVKKPFNIDLYLSRHSLKNRVDCGSFMEEKPCILVDESSIHQSLIVQEKMKTSVIGQTAQSGSDLGSMNQQSL
ncbi:Hypothetical predicted protein [Paramuricea clavata]|uniref:Uncharacterized protein n=1 Tax=Paramuricea clavata TaxID=317549 RepID=A0A7D9D8P9_PARCT|nr:Hypothetical predicted protein [Paramuricea clavata]